MGLESGYDEMEVEARVQDRGCEAGEGAGRVGPEACWELGLAESVLRRWMREVASAPTTAFPRNGQQRAELPGSRS